MIKKILISLLIVFFLSSSAQAINIYPDISNFNLTAGCKTSYNITINIDKEMLCYLETEILPDDEGIKINYSVDNPFLLQKGNNIINITISTSMLLIPGSYTIITSFLQEEQKSKRNKKQGGGSSTEDNDEAKPDFPEEPEEEPEEEEEREQEEEKKSKEEPNILWFYYLIFFILLLLLFILLVLFWSKRRKENEKT